jgi:hypothetical protein
VARHAWVISFLFIAASFWACDNGASNGVSQPTETVSADLFTHVGAWSTPLSLKAVASSAGLQVIKPFLVGEPGNTRIIIRRSLLDHAPGWLEVELPGGTTGWVSAFDVRRGDCDSLLKCPPLTTRDEEIRSARAVTLLELARELPSATSPQKFALVHSSAIALPKDLKPGENEASLTLSYEMHFFNEIRRITGSSDGFLIGSNTSLFMEADIRDLRTDGEIFYLTSISRESIESSFRKKVSLSSISVERTVLLSSLFSIDPQSPTQDGLPDLIIESVRPPGSAQPCTYSVDIRNVGIAPAIVLPPFVSRMPVPSHLGPFLILFAPPGSRWIAPFRVPLGGIEATENVFVDPLGSVPESSKQNNSVPFGSSVSCQTTVQTR